MFSVNRSAIAAVILLCLPLAACSSRSGRPSRRFELKGKVVSVNQRQAHVTIAHQEIPGYMPAMTMPFTVKEEWTLSVLGPGQTLQATLVVTEERSWLEDISIIQESPPAAASGRAASGPGEPEPGTRIPDFQLINQDAKSIRLGDYRGKMLLITFIYTRCPLPDYCPRMSSNFARIHAALRNDPFLEPRVHLLSVSFDPEFDTPKILRSYGEIYAGSADPSVFRHWEFASGSAADVRRIARFFGLDYRQDSGQIVHTLRTALIGPDGKLIRLYRGNDWTPAEILDQLRRMQ